MMSVTATSCVVGLVLLCTIPALFGQENDPYPVTIRPLTPYGIMVSVRDFPRMKYFEFQGTIALRLTDKLLGYEFNPNINIKVAKANNGFWTGKSYDVELRVGDLINYYVHTYFTRDRGAQERHTAVRWHNVTELFDANEPWTCRQTLTDVKYKIGESNTYCAGQIIFEDDFDTLREDIWTTEYYIPAAPGYPFVSYQPLAVSVKNSMLRIVPQLQRDMLGFSQDSIFKGMLDLSNRGCTRSKEYCNHKSRGIRILPPIVSGQITSGVRFAFKYGFVEVRAKVPQGDWLYPDIFLEAISNSFCTGHQRLLRIAGARGNLLLVNGTEEYGNKVLYGGPALNPRCRSNFLTKKLSTTEWGNDFHVYSVMWEPNTLTLFVDDEEWGRVNLTTDDLLSYLPSYESYKCLAVRTLLKQDDCMTPFDDFFGITLGMGVGGVLEFPDGVTSGKTPKPWLNKEANSPWHFYKESDTWLPTWTHKELLVDYVRVRAL